MFKVWLVVILIAFNPAVVHADDKKRWISYESSCGDNRDKLGTKVLNCLSDEDCSDKYQLLDIDIMCAIFKVFPVGEMGKYVDEDNVPSNIKENYAVSIYLGNRTILSVYKEFINNIFVDKRSILCSYRWIEDENSWICIKFEYRIDGKIVKFNKNLSGKDPVYDWVMDNMPKDREKTRYIDFGHSEFDSAIQ